MFYGLINIVFLVVLLFVDFTVSRQGHDPAAYLIILFGLLTLPILLVKEPNGPFSILLVTFPIFFMFYGVNDVLSYFIELPGYWWAPAGEVFSDGELAVLAGLLCWTVGYGAAVAVFGRRASKVLVMDWKVRDLIWVGLLCVSLGIAATWDALMASGKWEAHVSQGALKDTLIVLGRMMEPVGAVLLAYAYLKSSSRFILGIVMTIALLKFPMGLMMNSKEIGFSFILIFITTKWIHDGSLPTRWAMIGLAAMLVYMPFSYAYRATLGERHLSAAEAISDFSKLFDKAVEKNASTSDSASGIQAFAGRIDLKSLMELIMARIGKDVPFQEGHTLIELPLVFIPRLIMPDKPYIPVGKLFNQELQISANPETYISTSFLGELYWNYAWSGIVLGMFLVGLSMGLVGATTNMQQHKTITRLLLLVSAIYLLSLRFETGIAQQYALFMRSAVIVLCLHMVFRTKPVVPNPFK